MIFFAFSPSKRPFGEDFFCFFWVSGRQIQEKVEIRGLRVLKDMFILFCYYFLGGSVRYFQEIYETWAFEKVFGRSLVF